MLPDTDEAVDEVVFRMSNIDEAMEEVASILVKSGPRANTLSVPSAVPKFEGRVPVKLFCKNTLPQGASQKKSSAGASQTLP